MPNFSMRALITWYHIAFINQISSYTIYLFNCTPIALKTRYSPLPSARYDDPALVTTLNTIYERSSTLLTHLRPKLSVLGSCYPYFYWFRHVHVCTNDYPFLLNGFSSCTCCTNDLFIILNGMSSFTFLYG